LEADKEFTFFHEGTGKVHIIGMKQRYLCFAGSDSELESFDLDSDIEALDQDAYYLGSGSDDEEDSEESGLNDDEINAIIKGELKKRKRGMEKTKVVPEQQDADSDSDSEPPAKKPKTNNTNGNTTPNKAVLPSKLLRTKITTKRPVNQAPLRLPKTLRKIRAILTPRKLQMKRSLQHRSRTKRTLLQITPRKLTKRKKIPSNHQQQKIAPRITRLHQNQ
jgi:hypothetical protein